MNKGFLESWNGQRRLLGGKQNWIHLYDNFPQGEGQQWSKSLFCSIGLGGIAKVVSSGALESGLIRHQFGDH